MVIGVLFSKHVVLVQQWHAKAFEADNEPLESANFVKAGVPKHSEIGVSLLPFFFVLHFEY